MASKTYIEYAARTEGGTPLRVQYWRVVVEQTPFTGLQLDPVAREWIEITAADYQALYSTDCELDTTPEPTEPTVPTGVNFILVQYDDLGLTGLVNASVVNQLRLERLDGVFFADTGWYDTELFDGDPAPGTGSYRHVYGKLKPGGPYLLTGREKNNADQNTWHTKTFFVEQPNKLDHPLNQTFGYLALKGVRVTRDAATTQGQLSIWVDPATTVCEFLIFSFNNGFIDKQDVTVFSATAAGDYRQRQGLGEMPDGHYVLYVRPKGTPDYVKFEYDFNSAQPLFSYLNPDNATAVTYTVVRQWALRPVSPVYRINGVFPKYEKGFGLTNIANADGPCYGKLEPLDGQPFYDTALYAGDLFDGTLQNGSYRHIYTAVPSGRYLASWKSEGSSTFVSKEITVVRSNVAPTVMTPYPDQIITQAGDVALAPIAGTFTDADGDVLSLTAQTTDANGAFVPLSAIGIQFNPSAARPFTVPAGFANKQFFLRIRATDPDGLYVEDDSLQTVRRTTANPPPLATSFPNQTITLAGEQRFSVPVDAITDPADSLTFSAAQNTGAELPNGLVFDAASRTFIVPGAYPNSQISIRYRGTDSAGQSADLYFLLIVNRPVSSNTIRRIGAYHPVGWRYVSPTGRVTENLILAVTVDGSNPAGADMRLRYAQSRQDTTYRKLMPIDYANNPAGIPAGFTHWTDLNDEHFSDVYRNLNVFTVKLENVSGSEIDARYLPQPSLPDLSFTQLYPF